MVDFYDLSQTTGTTTWKWTIYNDNSAAPLISNEQNPTDILFNKAGTFSVSLKVTDDIGSSTLVDPDFITITCPNAINENFNPSPILKVYPNPSVNIFTVEGSNLPNELHFLSIINTIGEIVYYNEVLIKNSKLFEQFDLSEFSSGIYLLSIKSGSLFNTIRIEKR